MKADIDTLDCGRKDDLIGFLYDELDEAERFEFVKHTQTCAECKLELSSLSDTRSEVVSWRDATLGALTPVAVQPALDRVIDRRRSALAALRGFFDLSPLWMKGAVAFTSLLFCVLAVLVVTQLRSKPEQVVMNSPNNSAVSTKEINEQVERRVKDELERREAAKKSNELTATNEQPGHEVTPRVIRRNNQVAIAPNTKKASRPLTKQERQELAADLRLLADGEDGDLLLIGDRINQ